MTSLMKRAEALNQWCLDQGYLRADEMEDGYIVALVPAATSVQIIKAEPLSVVGGGIVARWSYLTTLDAFYGWNQWVINDYQEEPEGWIRHQPSNRRRLNGNSKQEYVSP